MKLVKTINNGIVVALLLLIYVVPFGLLAVLVRFFSMVSKKRTEKHTYWESPSFSTKKPDFLSPY